MRKFIYISVVFLILSACGKDDEKVNVSYKVSNAFADTEVSYRNNSTQIITELIEFESGEDVWNYNMQLQRGEIVYLSAMYQDTASSVKIQILVDGKVYKQGSSNNEPEKYIIVSGTIPFK